jgi:septal ring factor EnvC (AmiA/AmiB activator)
MKTVDQVVSEWTEEERERFKDLIEECREREKRLIENSRANKKNLTEFMGSLVYLSSVTNELKENTEKLRDAFLRIYLNLYNQKMPSA